MIVAKQLDLPSLVQAKLRSERIRIVCMMALSLVFLLIGLFRVVTPWNGGPTTGWIVFGMSAALLGFETMMFCVVRAKLTSGKPLDHRLGILHGVAECSYPISAVFVLTLVSPDDRFTFLVSPAYAFLLILVAVSVLRVDWRATMWTGLFAFAGYIGLVVWTVAVANLAHPNPHPIAMYFNLALMIGIATAVSVFVARQIQGYVESAVREMEFRRQHDRLKRDLEIASEIQQRLLPSSMPTLAGYDFAAISQPADETGGDYYDWQSVGPNRIVFSLADVTGHGVGPALVTAACRAYVRVIMGHDSGQASVLSRVNGLLQADLPEGRFVTLALLDVDGETNTAHLLSAGHGPTFLIRGSDGASQEIDSQGLPLGIADDPLLEEPVKFMLSPGDLVVLCSDGFIEPADPDGEEFGTKRLLEVIQSSRQKSAAEIVHAMDQAVRAFMAGSPQPDDMTAAIIKRKH